MVCNNKKRQLYKLESPSIKEVSVVKRGSNLIETWDIVKSQNGENMLEELRKEILAKSSFSEELMEYQEDEINRTMWYLFIDTLNYKLNDIRWEDKAEKEEKLMEITNLFEEFLTNFKANPLIKQKSNPENITKENEMTKTEELLEKFTSVLEKLMPAKQIEKEAVKTEGAEVQEELEKAQEALSAKDIEVAKLAKAKEDAETKLAEIEKSILDEKAELEKARQEQLEVARKVELVKMAEEKLSFAKGTPEENAEMLSKLEKSLGEDNKELFDFVVSSLEKQSEKVEGLMGEAGESTPESSLEKTATQEIEGLAKARSEEFKISFESAYGSIIKEKPELFEKAIREV